MNIEGMTYHYKLMIDVVSGGQRQKYTNIASAINTNFITLSRFDLFAYLLYTHYFLTCALI